MALNIGIDFGTSTIYVTRWNAKKKQAEPIPNITRNSAERFIDNIVFYENNDNIILGQKAKHKGVAYPENLISYVKRYFDDDQWSTYIKNIERHLTASEIATDIFKFLKNRIEELHGGDKIESVVLSVPFAFETTERNLIQKSAENAGLNVIRLIEEPISAGISYGFFHDDHFENHQPQTILIFDLGGGTFDIAIFKLSKEEHQLNIEVLGTGGDKLLGGKDIDDTIFYKFCKQLGIKLTDIDKKLTRRDINDLKTEAKNLKENLSESDSYEVILSLRDLNQVLEYEVTVDDLNEWLIETNFIKKIMSTLNSTLQKCQLKPDQIQKIILVGGTTNIPLIQQTVEEYFNRKIEMLKNPAEMVGEGNGILCGSIHDADFKFNLITPNNKQQIIIQNIEEEHHLDEDEQESLDELKHAIQESIVGFSEYLEEIENLLLNTQTNSTPVELLDALNSLRLLLKIDIQESKKDLKQIHDYQLAGNLDNILPFLEQFQENQSNRKKQIEVATKNFNKLVEELGSKIESYENQHLNLEHHELDTYYIKNLKNQIAKNKKDASLYSNLGYAYAELKLYNQAVECYQMAVELEPNDKNMHFQLAYNLDELKQYEDAIKHYKMSIELDPKDKISYNNLGIIYDDLDRYEDLINLYQRYLKLFPDNQLKAYKNLAKAFYELKNNVEALKYFELCIELDPKNSYCHFQVAYISNELKDYNKAKIHYQKVIEIEPEDKHVYNNLGNIFKQETNYAKAIELYRKSIAITPDYLYSYQGLAYCYHQLNQTISAITTYEKVIELDPQDTWAYSQLGYIYRDQKEYQIALDYYVKVLKINPEHADSLFQMAYIYGELKQPQQAITYYQKCIEIKPNNALAYNNLGCEYSNLKDEKQAIRAFTRALEIDPNHKLAKQNLAGYA